MNYNSFHLETMEYGFLQDLSIIVGSLLVIVIVLCIVLPPTRPTCR